MYLGDIQCEEAYQIEMTQGRSICIIGFCEHGSEPFRFLKSRILPEQLNNYQLFKKDPALWNYLGLLLIILKILILLVKIFFFLDRIHYLTKRDRY
jgi:hypothetical protein